MVILVPVVFGPVCDFGSGGLDLVPVVFYFGSGGLDLVPVVWTLVPMV